MQFEKIIELFKIEFGNDKIEKFIEHKVFSIDENCFTISMKKTLTKLCDISFTIEINYGESKAAVNMCYINYHGNPYKLNIIQYDDNNNMTVIDESRLHIENDNIFIDGVKIDFDDHDNCNYEFDSDETVEFNKKDFNFYLKKYPFSKKIEEDDGICLLKSVKLNPENVKLLIEWLKSILNN